MLVKIRNASQSWAAKFVAGLIIVVLTLFGFGAFNLFAVNEPAVATINGKDITERQLAAEIERTKQSYRDTYGESITEEQLDRFINEQFALQRLINTELFMQAGDELDLTLSDQQFEKLLLEAPEFQADGKFDETLYRESLERGGMSTQTLRGQQRDSRVRTDLLRALEDTSFVTGSETRLNAKFDKQVRDISVLEFDHKNFEDPDSVTDEDIATHYDLNHDLYMTDGTYDFEYIEINRERFLSNEELSEEELQALYEAEMTALESNAKRRGRHLLIKINETRTDEEALELITEIRERIDAGESLGDLATELSEDAGSKADGGDLGFSDRDQYVKEFSDSLWSLELNEISAPVKTTFGYHIIELLEVEDIEHPPFEERRDGLLEAHRLDLAAGKLKDAFDEVDKLAFEQSNSLAPIADEFEVDIQMLQSVNHESIEGIFADTSVRSAFMDSDVIDSGFNSRVVEVGEEAIIVGRLTDRTEPTLKPLEEVTAEIKQQLVSEAAFAARDAKHAEVFAQLREDKNYDAAALAAGAEWGVFEGVKRDSHTLDPGILTVAFAEPLPVDGDRVIVTADSEYLPSKYIVTTARQKLADFAVLESSEQEELEKMARDNVKERVLTSFLVSLRSEASIKTDALVADP